MTCQHSLAITNADAHSPLTHSIQGAASVAFIVFDLANLPQDGLDSALHLISDVHALLLCKSTLACGDDATQQTINWLVTPALLVLQLADCNPFQWEGYGQADKALYATCVLTAAASAAGVLAAAVAVCQHPRSLGQLLGWTQPVAWCVVSVSASIGCAR
jgi:hypothetical protein